MRIVSGGDRQRESKAPRRDWIDFICRIACVFALGFGGLAAAAAWSKGLGPTPPRFAIFVSLPILVAASGACLLLANTSLRKLGCLYGGAAGAAVLAVELFLAYQAATPPAPGPDPAASVAAARLSEAYRSGAVPVVCASMLLEGAAGGGMRSVLSDPGGAPLLPFAGLSRRSVARLAQGKVTAAPSDRFGFNNPDSVWDRAEPAPVVFIGDSFTYGADVPFDAGFVDRVRKAMPGTVNLGCGGNGPITALAALQEYGPRLRPPVVVWGYYEGNDLTKDIHREAASPLLSSYLAGASDRPQGLVDRQIEIDRAMERFIEAWRRHRASDGETRAAPEAPAAVSLRQVFSQAVTLFSIRSRLGLSQDFSDHALVLADQAIARMQAVVGGWGGRLIVLHIPSETRWLNLFAESDVQAYTERVRAVVEKHGAEWVSAAPVLAAHSADPRELYAGHFTPEGYRIVGERLVEFLRDTGD